jgi:hypothetical protein
MMRRLLPYYPTGTIITAAPEGAFPRRIGDKDFKKNSLPAMPEEA